MTNTGTGTGVVIDTTNGGLILTNNHVVRDTTVGIIFANDKDNEAVTLGSVIKIDQIKDLALVQVNEKHDLIPLEIDTSL